MSERSVQLHLRTPTERQDMGTGLGAGQSQGMPSAPGDGSAERFKQAMAKASDLAPAAPLPGEQSAVTIGNPMGLFGGAAPAAAPGVHPGVMGLLKDSLKGLQVGQEQRSVRMELDDALYPGVAVAVFEDAGAWVAEFRCSQLESYRSLSEPAQDMARQLADELQRDALWRVIDESDGPVADGDTDHTTEAFASAPAG
jgi:hypothetical protein